MSSIPGAIDRKRKKPRRTKSDQPYPMYEVSETWMKDCQEALSDRSVREHLNSMQACSKVARTTESSKGGASQGLIELEKLVSRRGSRQPPTSPPSPPKSHPDTNNATRGSAYRVQWFKSAVLEIAELYGRPIMNRIFSEGFVVVAMPSVVDAEAYALTIVPPEKLAVLGRSVIIVEAVEQLPRTAFVVDREGYLDESYFVVLADSAECRVSRTPVNRRHILDKMRRTPWGSDSNPYLPPGVVDMEQFGHKDKLHRYDTTRVEYVVRTTMTSALDCILPLVDMYRTASDVTQHYMHNPPPRVLVLDGGKVVVKKDHHPAPRMSTIMTTGDLNMEAMEMDREARELIEAEEQEKRREDAEKAAVHENMRLIELPAGSVVSKDLPPAADPSSIDDAHRRLVTSLGIGSLVGTTATGKGGQDRAQPWGMFAIVCELRTKEILGDVNPCIVRILAYLVAMFMPGLEGGIMENSEKIRRHMEMRNLVAPDGADEDILDTAATVMARHQTAAHIVHWSWGPHRDNTPLKFQLPEYLMLLSQKESGGAASPASPAADDQ